MAFDSVKGYADLPLDLPCGQCIGCRAERSRQWAIRIIHESQTHPRSAFLTLTYDEEHLPSTGSLDTRTWQLFAKRLRKRIGRFRYYAIGEYGEAHDRPHYHACIFGEDFRDDRIRIRETPHALYFSRTLTDTWGQGFASVGNLTYETANYVARYVLKKRTGPQAKHHYRRIDPDTGEETQLKPEFACMSRKPGIGSSWLEKYRDDVYPSDEIIHEGKRFRPPRFYDQQLHQDQAQELKRKRREKVGLRQHELTPERLKARERAALSKQQTYDLNRKL